MLCRDIRMVISCADASLMACATSSLVTNWLPQSTLMPRPFCPAAFSGSLDPRSSSSRSVVVAACLCFLFNITCISYLFTCLQHVYSLTSFLFFVYLLTCCLELLNCLLVNLLPFTKVVDLWRNRFNPLLMSFLGKDAEEATRLIPEFLVFFVWAVSNMLNR